MKQQLIFPENFWWGAATSGPQSEGWAGKRHENVMDYWYRTQRKDFFDHTGPDVASDFYHKYPEDLKTMAGIGMNSWRTSIQWSRLIKDLETGEVDEEAVAFYKKMIAEARKNGLITVMNLHHFDMPMELMEKYGGWESRHVVELYARFAASCFEIFGDEIDYWVTFNEPMVIPEAGYLEGFHYPKLKHESRRALQVMYHINLASAMAVREFRRLGKTGKIGIICNLTPSYPKTDAPEDKAAAEFADDFFNYSFVQPALKGTFPEKLEEVLEKDGVIWKSTEEDMQIIRDNTVDFLGINYYQPKRVQAPEPFDPADPWVPQRYYAPWTKPDARMNPYRGWEIYPKAIYDIAIDMTRRYPDADWFISENGMGVEGEEAYRDKDGNIDDQYRIDFYEEHLAWLWKAIQEGAHCFGFHAWTPFDCWSWNNAYKNRYGFIGIDLDDQSRTVKKSGQWLKKVSAANGFEYDLDSLKK